MTSFAGFYETALGPSEIVTAAASRCRRRAVYEKSVTRSAEDRPCVGVFAACRRTTPGRYTDIRTEMVRVWVRRALEGARGRADEVAPAGGA